MNRIRVFSIAVLAAAALACAAFALAQSRQRTQTQPTMAVERTRDSRLIGIDVVRMLNTAEAKYKSQHGAYADWSELYRFIVNGDASMQPRFSGLQITAGPEVVPGWNLNLIASADRRGYEFALRNVDDKACRFSFFSDESALIYQGDVIGCPSAQVIPASQ
ncbi:MAG TPA: hypothetical protein VGR81_02035 [Candidatus Acidoferrales bacterium]|nr:hypothetical protein [Candidatus Acidoferrales bacterium]